MEEERGTAWKLKLTRGDVVELMSDYNEGSAKEGAVRSVRKITFGIVIEGPKTNKDSTSVLYLASSEHTENELGKTTTVWSGFNQFRRLVPADKARSIINRLRKGLEAFAKW